jgi:hypothetical protein
MLKGKRLQSGKYVVEIDSKTKGKRRNKKPPSEKLTSLEKIQLHINRALGRPGPKTLPKLTDEEYLVLQSKMISLKNVKIGRSDFGIGQVNTFATPIMETNTSYPSIPQGLAVPLPAQITQGYDIINGNIIPTPLPSRLDAIKQGRIQAPEQQNPMRPPLQPVEVMRPPEEGLLNQRVISRDEYDRENMRRRQEELLALSNAMRAGMVRGDVESIYSLPIKNELDRKRQQDDVNILDERQRMELDRRSDRTATTVKPTTLPSTTPMSVGERAELAWDMASNPSKYTGSQSGPSTTPAYTMFRDEDTPGYNEVIAGLNMAEYSEEPGRRMDESETEYRDRLRRLVDFQHDRRTIPDEA